MLNLDNVDINDRSQSQLEIQALIDRMFEAEKYMNFERFKDVTENICSDLFIIVP